MKGEKRIVAAMAFALASHVVIPASAGRVLALRAEHRRAPLAGVDAAG
jgi:hypothetical protein